MLGKNTNSTKKLSTFKKNKRAKFNAKEYLRKHVIDKEGRAIIPIYIQNKNEMFNKHDLRGMTLSEDIRDYIDEVAYDIPYDYEIIFEIQCEEELTDYDKERISKVIKLYYGLEMNGVDFDLGVCKRRRNGLFIMAVLSIIIAGISLKYFDGLFLELVLIALWYAIWEGVDVILYDEGDLIYERLDAEQLFNAKTEFKNMNE